MIIDESVWYEQIDTALIDYLKSNLSIEDKGVKIPVPSSVRKAEEDFKVESYPSTSIYCISSMFDYDRYSSKSISRFNKEAGNCQICYPVLPFKFQYQIDFWTKYQSHRNSLIAQWMRLHTNGTRINLPVIDASGLERLANMSMSGGIVYQDDIVGIQRTFRAILTYNIWAELDDVRQDTVPVVLHNSFSIRNKLQED